MTRVIEVTKKRYVVPSVLVLLAFGLRLARLSFQPLWWDEGWSVYFATMDVGGVLERTAVDIHPPLYYLLLHVWIQLFGSSVASVRFLSVVIGTLTVLLIYIAGRLLLNRRGALIAAFLLTIAPLHIYYSQEVRMYGLVTLLGLAASLFALQWDFDQWDSWKWAGYVMVATAALYTQYYAGFLLLALNLVVFIRWLRGRHGLRSLASWLAAQLTVFLLFLPWLWYAGGKLVTYVRFKVGVEEDLSLGLLTYLGRHLAAFTWGHAEGALADWWWLGLVPLVSLVVALLFVLWRHFGEQGARKRAPGTFGNQDTGDPPFILRHRMLALTLPFVVLAIILLCGFVVNLVFPFNPPRSERLLLLALPSFLVLIAGTLTTLWPSRRWLAIALTALFTVAAVVSLAFFYAVPRYPEEDYRPVAERVRILGLPSDAVINVQPWQVGYLTSYIPDDEARPTLVLTPRQVIPHERQFWAEEAERMAADLDTLLAEHGRLWLVDHRAMGRVLEKKIEAYLVEHAYPTLSEWYGENTVLSFFSAGEPEAQSVTARFGNWLSLDSAALSPDPLEAGWDVVAVDLIWRLLERPGEPYHVSLRLMDKTGRIWAQRDSAPRGGLEHFVDWPLDEPQRDSHGLLVPAGTPPGDYQVMLRIYRSKDVEVLPVTFEGSSRVEVNLGPVRVVRPQASPPVEALYFEQAVKVDFDDRLRLLGYNLHSDPALLPGEAAEADLFWQALVDPGEDFLPRLQLLDPEGEIVAEQTKKPVADTYPTAWWRAGELVRDPQLLPIPAAVLPGRYLLRMSMVRAEDGALMETAQGQTVIDLAEIEVQSREHQFGPTFPAHIQAARFGLAVELIGYDMREVVRAPGSPLELTLHWHALQTPDTNYHVFVHLLDAEGKTVAQVDGPPVNGESPMLGWLPGEYLTDTHSLQLPFDLPDGDYRLGVGLYDPSTLVRPGEQVILNVPVRVSASEGCECR